MDTSWKASRATAAAISAVTHVLFVWFFFHALGSTRTTTYAPSIEPFVVSLISEPRRPPIPVVLLTLTPKLPRFQVRAPKETPDLKFEVPAEPARTANPNTAIAASPGPRGPTDQAGGPSAITVIHYVAPRYPYLPARSEKYGDIILALLVNALGGVDQIEILQSTGSPQLDKAAISAVRQWRFAPFKRGARGEPVWTRAKLEFAAPQRLVGVPLDIVPYAAVAQEINVALGKDRRAHMWGPSAEPSLRRVLQRLIVAVASKRRQNPGMNPVAAGVSPEAELGLLGSIRSVKFLGFVDHGIDRDNTSPPDLANRPPLERTHWEVYDVEQNRGSSVWLIASTPNGSIRHIEVAVRQSSGS